MQQSLTVVALFLLTATISPSWATPDQDVGGSGGSAGGKMQVRSGQPTDAERKKIQEDRQKWLASLKLTPDQKKKWTEIEARYSKQMREKISGAPGKPVSIDAGSPDGMKKIQEIQALQKKKRDEQRGLLTPEQKVIFDKAPDPGWRVRKTTAQR